MKLLMWKVLPIFLIQELLKHVYEPIIDATIITPTEYLGNMIKLCEEKRGIQHKYELSR